MPRVVALFFPRPAVSASPSPSLNSKLSVLVIFLIEKNKSKKNNFGQLSSHLGPDSSWKQHAAFPCQTPKSSSIFLSCLSVLLQTPNSCSSIASDVALKLRRRFVLLCGLAGVTAQNCRLVQGVMTAQQEEKMDGCWCQRLCADNSCIDE